MYLLPQSFFRILREGLCASAQRRAVRIGAVPGNGVAWIATCVSHLRTSQLCSILVAVALVMQPVAETTVSATPVLIPLRTDFVPFGESLQLPQLPVIQFSTARVPKQNYLVAASATAVVLPILLGRPSRNGMTARCTSSEQGLPSSRAPPRG